MVVVGAKKVWLLKTTNRQGPPPMDFSEISGKAQPKI